MKIKIMKSLLSVAILAAMSNSAFAANTTAGTTINNTAVISYSVSTVAQTPIESSGAAAGNTTPGVGNGAPTQFKVDKKIDLTVTGGGSTFKVPTQATDRVSTFTVKNTGNSDEFFKLEANQVATSAPTDVFNTSNCTIHSPTASAALTEVALTKDQTKTITIKCDTPANNGTNVVDGAKSEIDLKATAVIATGSSTAYTESASDSVDPLVVDVVLADGLGTTEDGLARNASHSAVATYEIETADLTVKKLSAIYSDPKNSTSNPKRIPDSVVKYTITIENTGSVTATSVKISDHIPTDMTYVTTATAAPSTAPADCAVTGSVAAATCSYNANLLIGAVTKAGIESSAFDIAAGATATVIFYAKVN